MMMRKLWEMMRAKISRARKHLETVDAVGGVTGQSQRSRGSRLAHWLLLPVRGKRRRRGERIIRHHHHLVRQRNPVKHLLVVTERVVHHDRVALHVAGGRIGVHHPTRAVPVVVAGVVVAAAVEATVVMTVGKVGALAGVGVEVVHLPLQRIERPEI